MVHCLSECLGVVLEECRVGMPVLGISHHEILVDFCTKLQGSTVEPVDEDIWICLSSQHKTPACAASDQMESWLALWCRSENQDQAAELSTWE